MKTMAWLMLIVAVLFTASARPAQAQYMKPWFNGLGVSVGGGPTRFQGGRDDPSTAWVRPEDDTVGTAAFGICLSLGTRRWMVMLPELHYVPVLADTTPVNGTLTLGSGTVPFEANKRSSSAIALMLSGQLTPVPRARVWLRGGIGEGWVSARVEAPDQRIGIDLQGASGLALSGAVGISLWTRGAMSVDAEAHYLTIRAGELRVASPSVRVGWRAQAPKMPWSD